MARSLDYCLDQANEVEYSSLIRAHLVRRQNWDSTNSRDMKWPCYQLAVNLMLLGYVQAALWIFTNLRDNMSDSPFKWWMNALVHISTSHISSQEAISVHDSGTHLHEAIVCIRAISSNKLTTYMFQIRYLKLAHKFFKSVSTLSSSPCASSVANLCLSNLDEVCVGFLDLRNVLFDIDEKSRDALLNMAGICIYAIKMTSPSHQHSPQAARLRKWLIAENYNKHMAEGGMGRDWFSGLQAQYKRVAAEERQVVDLLRIPRPFPIYFFTHQCANNVKLYLNPRPSQPFVSVSRRSMFVLSLRGTIGYPKNWAQKCILILTLVGKRIAEFLIVNVETKSVDEIGLPTKAEDHRIAITACAPTSEDQHGQSGKFSSSITMDFSDTVSSDVLLIVTASLMDSRGERWGTGLPSATVNVRFT